MKDEKKEPIKCPACGIDNARNRITCQVCHERLIPNPARMSSPEKATKGEKKSRKKKETSPEEKADIPVTKFDDLPPLMEQIYPFLDSTKEEIPPSTSPLKQRNSQCTRNSLGWYKRGS